MAGSPCVTPQAFRNVCLQFANSGFIQQEGRWNAFISQLSEAHEKDVMDAKAHATAAAAAAADTVKTNGEKKGLHPKDLKPAKFDSDTKSAQRFRQFAQDATAYVKQINRSLAEMLKVAAKLEEWNAETYQEQLAEEASIGESEARDLDEDLVALLRSITDVRRPLRLLDTVHDCGRALGALREEQVVHPPPGLCTAARRIDHVPQVSLRDVA